MVLTPVVNKNRKSPKRTTIHCLYVNQINSNGFPPVLLISVDGDHSWTLSQKPGCHLWPASTLLSPNPFHCQVLSISPSKFSAYLSHCHHPHPCSHHPQGWLTQPPSPFLPFPVHSPTEVSTNLIQSTNLISPNLFCKYTHIPLKTPSVSSACQCSYTQGFDWIGTCHPPLSGPLTTPRPCPRGLYTVFPHQTVVCPRSPPAQRPTSFQLVNSDLSLPTSALLFHSICQSVISIYLGTILVSAFLNWEERMKSKILRHVGWTEFSYSSRMTLAVYYPGISEKTVTQIILCSVVQMKTSGLERFVPNSISHSRCSNICW